MKLLKQTFTYLALSSVVFFTSCEKDEKKNDVVDVPSYEIPESYNFENASYSGQVERLNMLAELEAYLKTANNGDVIDAATAKAMYANEGYTWTSSAFEIEQPTKNLKSKTTSDQQAEVESLIDQLVDLSVNGSTTTSEDGAKTTYFDENGLEPIQLIVKGIMGSCFYYQGTSVDLSDGKMAVDNDNLVEGKVNRCT